MSSLWTSLLVLAWAGAGLAAWAAQNSGGALLDPVLFGVVLAVGFSAYPAWRLWRIVKRTAPANEWLRFTSTGTTLATRAVKGVESVALQGIPPDLHWAGQQLLCLVVDHLRAHPGNSVRANLVHHAQQLPHDVELRDGVVVDTITGLSTVALAAHLNAMAEPLLGQHLAIPLLEASLRLFPGDPRTVTAHAVPNENNCMAAKAMGDTLLERGRVEEGLRWLEESVARSPQWAAGFMAQVKQEVSPDLKDPRVPFWRDLDVEAVRARVLARVPPVVTP